METWLPELESFLQTFCKNNKIRIHLPKIELSTTLDKDLNIFDIDMDLLLKEFIKKFEVSISNFNWNNHGGYPHDSALIGLIKFAFGHNPNFYQPKLFVSDLQSAIITRELI